MLKEAQGKLFVSDSVTFTVRTANSVCGWTMLFFFFFVSADRARDSVRHVEKAIFIYCHVHTRPTNLLSF